MVNTTTRTGSTATVTTKPAAVRRTASASRRLAAAAATARSRSGSQNVPFAARPSAPALSPIPTCPDPYPETAAEYDEIYRVMLKKLGLKTAVTSISAVATEDQYLGLSGSDLEAVLVRATLEAEAADSSEVKAEHLQKAFSDFIPPANSREREMQILCAVLECTSRELLPERFRTLDRGEVQARINEIKRDLRLL